MAKTTPQLTKQKKQLLNLYRQALKDGVAIQDLNKKVNYFLKQDKASLKGEQHLDEQIKMNFWRRLPRTIRVGATLLPLALIAFGLVLALSALWPIIDYYLPWKKEEEIALLSPIPHSQLLLGNPLISAQAQVDVEENPMAGLDTQVEPVILDQAVDFTDLTNWFGDDLETVELSTSEFIEYSLEIPSLNVSSAKVRVGGSNLNQSLIHYPGTALPGQLGAPVIFGHSVLRQFYNPSENNPRRYNSIFSKIMMLEKGEKIYLTHDNVKYTYIVQGKTEVKPNDTFILAQRVDVRQLKLVTCIPEGTTLRRGIVTAQLVKE
ncbi:MAG: sortase [Candidatus Pacebacteria bacterium]|jgi:LPXTG-site transpeptidase (sortase) family protein|nr:sortase [Candidatus Paceibacterota bacterium]